MNKNDLIERCAVAIREAHHDNTHSHSDWREIDSISVRTVLKDPHIARALALLDRVGDAAADAIIKGEAEVFWSKEEAEASEVLTALRNAPPGPDVIPEHERFVSRARVWAIKNRAAMGALLKGEAAVVPWPVTVEMVQASNPVDDAQDLLAHFTLHEGIAAGRLDREV